MKDMKIYSESDAHGILLNEAEDKFVWDRLKELNFNPSYSLPSRTFSHLPFDADVYDVGKMTADDMDRLNELAVQAVINVTVKDELVYALDWQHSSLLFDPRKPETMRNFYVNDKRYHGGGYNVYFPDFFPDGDYYFFIAKDFRFGWLGHPWQQTVWIFGSRFKKEIAKIADEVNMTVLDSKQVRKGFFAVCKK